MFCGIRPPRLPRQTAHVLGAEPADSDIADSVRWAIEQATGITCKFRGGELSAAAPAGTAKRLGKLARHVAQGFKALLEQFAKSPGVATSDRRLFVRGLYDGMMNDLAAGANGCPEPSAAEADASGRQWFDQCEGAFRLFVPTRTDARHRTRHGDGGPDAHAVVPAAVVFESFHRREHQAVPEPQLGLRDVSVGARGATDEPYLAWALAADR